MKLTVGTLSFEDYYLYSYGHGRTWGKLHGPVIGMCLGWFYLELQKYRQANAFRKRRFRKLYYMHTRPWVAWAIILFFWGFLFNLTVLLPYKPNNNAYAWDNWMNALYSALCNLTFAIGVCAPLVCVFIGRFLFIRNILSMKIWTILNKFTYGAYLIYPVTIFMLYGNTYQGFYLRLLELVWALIHHIGLTYAISFCMFILIDNPLANVRKIITERVQQWFHPGPIAVPLSETVMQNAALKAKQLENA